MVSSLMINFSISQCVVAKQTDILRNFTGEPPAYKDWLATKHEVCSTVFKSKQNKNQKTTHSTTLESYTFSLFPDHLRHQLHVL